MATIEKKTLGATIFN